MNLEKELNQLRLLSKELIKTLDRIEGKESIDSNNSSISISNTKKDTELVNKDTKFLKKLIELQKKNNNSTSFLENLLNNDYKTLSAGQYAVVVKIANDLNASPDDY